MASVTPVTRDAIYYRERCRASDTLLSLYGGACYDHILNEFRSGARQATAARNIGEGGGKLCEEMRAAFIGGYERSLGYTPPRLTAHLEPMFRHVHSNWGVTEYNCLFKLAPPPPGDEHGKEYPSGCSVYWFTLALKSIDALGGHLALFDGTSSRM